MFCYKDKTFCSASMLTCFNDKCYRFMSDEESLNVAMLSDKDGFAWPVAYNDFSEGCKERIEKKC